jgi:hypothetical protein
MTQLGYRTAGLISGSIALILEYDLAGIGL